MKKGLRPRGSLGSGVSPAGIVDLMKKGLRHIVMRCSALLAAGIVDLMKKGLRLFDLGECGFQGWPESST